MLAGDAAFFDTVMASLPAFVVKLDAELRIQFANRVLTHFSRHEVIGASVLDFLVEHDAQRARATFMQVLSSGVRQELALSVHGAGGEILTFDVVVSRLQAFDEGEHNLVLVGSDITSELSKTRSLMEQREKLRLAAYGTGIGLWSWTPSSGEIYWDERMYELYPDAAEPFPLEVYLERYVHPEDRERAAENARLCMGEPQFTITNREFLPDGTQRWVKTVASVTFDESGQPQVVYGGTIDVSEEHEKEARLRQRQKVEAIGKLAGGIAHNFNNMLAAIHASLELLRRNTGPEMDNVVGYALQAVDKGATLVHQLLTYAGEGGHQNDVETIAVEHLVDDAVDLCRRTFPPRIEVSAKVDGSLAIRGSSSDITQVLVSLLLNARDALRDCHEPRIEVGAAPATLPNGSLAVLISISDNGIGIASEVQERIFDPFFTTKGPAGTGLGLSTSAAVVRDLGGHIECHSSSGQGTKMEVLIPTADSERPVEEIEPVPPVASPTKLSILFVEDTKVVADSIGRLLRALGHHVAIADSCRGARELAPIWRDVDVFLLDFSLPDGTGADLLHPINQIAPTAKVVFLSAGTLDATVHSRADAVLQKPVSADALERTLAAVVSKSI